MGKRQSLSTKLEAERETGLEPATFTLEGRSLSVVTPFCGTLSGAGSSEALKPAALACTDVTHTPTADATTEYRWLAVDNVALLVRTNHGPTTEDRAFLDRLAGALECATTQAE